MGSTVTEKDIAEFRELAEKGTGKDQEYAKAALAALPREAAPESEKTAPEDSKVGAVPTETPQKEEEPKAKVEQAQEKPEPTEREMLPHPARLRIDREKREMRRVIENQQKQMEVLLKKFDELQPRKPEKSETDVLSDLLADPESYLRERDKRLMESFQKRFVEEQKKTTRDMARREIEHENARKILGSIDGYNDEDSQNVTEMLTATAKYLNEYEDTNAYSEEYVEQMWVENPLRMVKIMKKAWERDRKIPDQIKSDKRAATSAQVGSGKTPGGRPTTLQDLNAELAKAMSDGDKKAQDEIGKKIESLYSELHGKR